VWLVAAGSESGGSESVVSTVELLAQRRQTVAAIKLDPTTAAFKRRTTVPDNSGGTRPGPVTTLMEQTFTIVEPTTQLPERRTADGVAITPEYVLVGRWDADVLRGDWWFVNGVKYEIVFVHDNHLPENQRYQVKAEVAQRG
jgi:hypothetical protein